MIELPPKPRILVVTLRRLGDVLLTTPLIRSMRRAWPDATIDVLVFAGTAGIVEGNPDIDRVIAMPARRGVGDTLALIGKLFKRYDLAVSTQAGDRPTLFAFLAGRRHVGLIDPDGPALGRAVKAGALHRSTVAAPAVHRVEQMLRIADTLGIPRVPDVVCPAAAPLPFSPGDNMAVIHAAPMFRYKEWTPQGWQALAEALTRRGLSVVAIGGPDPAERRHLDDDLAGQSPDPSTVLAAERRTAATGAAVHRTGHLDDASRGGGRLPDRGAVRPDRSAAVGAVAGRRARCAVAGQRHDPESRQRLAGAKSAAVPAVPARRLRTPYRQRQRLPAGTDGRSGACRGRPGAEPAALRSHSATR